MPLNKISGLVNLPGPPIPITLPAGGIFQLPVGQGAPGTFGAISTPQLGTGNELTGQYLLQLGRKTSLQIYDPSCQYWRNVQAFPNGSVGVISADGANYRLANTTGCPVGALITNGGSSLTNGFNTVTVTPSAGSSVWNTIVGGSINSTITITNAGTNYLAPPIIVFGPPPTQGSTPYILPTATCTLTNGTIGSVTVSNVGAGLVAVPTITVIPAWGDTTGGGAVLTINATLANSGVLTALYPAANTIASSTTTSLVPQYAPYGSAQTAVVTFTFSPASSIAATAIMNWTITSFTQSTAGVAYVAAGAAFQGGYVSGSEASGLTNPLFDKDLEVPIFPPVTVAATTGLPALAGTFGGVNIQAVPTIESYSSGAAPSTAAVTTVNVGGASDTSVLCPI